jgi:prephenate dehydrogenase
MAVKANGLTARVHVWSRSEETRLKCFRQDWCDSVFPTAAEAVRGSDLVIVCTPVQTIAGLLEMLFSDLEPHALVTDVGSTKAEICAAVQSIFRGVGPTFIGSHPMAGSERAGMEHAKADLFTGAACILTQCAEGDDASLKRLIEFWEALGMRITNTSPETHDAIVAHVSHLPHLLASTLCTYLSAKDPDWRGLSGAGLRDTTRVAAGESELWRQILESNRLEVLGAIDGFLGDLNTLRDALAKGDSETVAELLERGRIYREGL